MQTRHPETRTKPANVLIAAVPTSDLIARIGNRYGLGVKLYIAESRPYEEDVASGIAFAAQSGYRVAICTDNMIGSLLKERKIDAVWSLYTGRERDEFTATNGALMCAILAREHGVPFILLHHPKFPRVPGGRFAGSSICVDGAGYVEHEFDRVPADLVTEVL
jgi:hypothetical protein